jgi:FtsP/CotA-like multicopper oxidase with cupredoxin domain
MSQISPAQAAPSNVVETTLTAREVQWELSPGKRVAALAYEGRVPGPELRAREGQRLRVTLANQLSVPTTIHWHGVDVPNSMDGAPDLTQPAVQPGASFTYEFDARPAGTRWFHTHFASTDQLDRGLYAPLIIEPATAETDPPHREYTLVFGAWVTGQSAPVPDPNGGGMMGSGSMMGPGGMMGPGSGRSGGMMGGANDPAYDTFTVNGKAYPSTAPLVVGEGERVRLRLINASGARTHLIHLEGHRLRVTHTDGNALQAPVEVDVVPIAPSERYDVELTANRPGVWSLHDLAPGQTEAGLRVPVVYAGREGQPEAPLRTGAGGLQSWSYGLGRGVDRLPRPSGATREFPLTLSGGMMGSDAWTINGQVYPSTDPLWIGPGDLVRLRLFNMSMQNHPMHLHGFSFRLTEVGGRVLDAPLIKDVVDLQPMERAELEFVADNPGDWMFHCHKPMHMDGGMVTLVRYRAT